MNKIKWCVGKKDGLNLIEPNNDLAKAYLIKAEEALESMRVNVVKDWKISTSYYALYFSLYAIMMKMPPLFFVKCKSILIKLNEKKINEIRKEFERV
jgi:hypothetical protein